MSSALQELSVEDDVPASAGPIADIPPPTSQDGRRPSGLRGTAARILTAVRPEEYLLVVIGAVFAYLHYTGVTKVVWKTTFIRAGWHLFIGFIQVFTAVAAWRAYRIAVDKTPKPSNGLIGIVVALPILAVGLFTAGLLHVKWEPEYLDYGWYGVATFVVGAFALSVRGLPPERRTQAMLGVAGSMTNDVFGFARDWLPFIALLSTYENALRLVGRVRSSLYDPEMFRLDDLLFRGHLDVWFQSIISPKTTEAFAFCYSGLYLFPIVVGMTLYLQWRHREFRAFLLAFIVAGWVGYVGYLLVPVIGPRFFYPELYGVSLNASHVSETVRTAAMQTANDAGMRFLALAEQVSDRAAYGGEYPRNCFPSLHTAWGVVVLICSYRYTRPLFYVLAIPLLGMIAATSYLRFHYMVDVLAGALLAVCMVTVMPRLDHAWALRHARAFGLPPPPSIVPPSRGPWERARLWLAYGAFSAFSAFVAAYVFRSDLLREKTALAASVLHDGESGERPSSSMDARFGDSIELVSAGAGSTTWTSDGLVHVELVWRALEVTEGNWKVFVHIRDARGRNVANADHHPVGGAYPVKKWQKGDIVKDTLTLRVPSGHRGSTLEVWVGLFDELRVDKRLPVTRAPDARPVLAQAVRVLEAKVR